MTDNSDPRTEPGTTTEPRRTTAPGTARESADGAGTTRESTTSRESMTGTGLTPGVTREDTPRDGLTPDTPGGATTGDGRDRSAKGGTHAGLSTPAAPRKAAAGRSDKRTGHQEDHGADRPLVSRDDQDKLSQRMQQAVTDFVESPRRAVEEADSTFDQIVSGLTEALTERRRVLRASWQEQDTEAQTEELRIALQRYRDLSEQLLKI
ncbi:hypothetical protein [Streptomyces sp. NPDC057428]|uniref:hypothetical protein n=1 Tax=Streptomyces sp. NPDC057428 TaxID=3346129 RepID=UPI00367C36C2